MAIYYGYSNAIFGTQSTVNGSAQDYAYGPPTGGTWTWTGTTTSFHVRENDGATLYNGDSTNEQVSTNEQLGGTWEQVTLIGGTYYQTIWDYTFEVTGPGPDFTVYRIGVIDVDLNNDDDLNDVVGGASEDGYYLVFPDGVPPAGVNYTIGGIVENDASTPHTGLGAQVVCFAAGTLIETKNGLVEVQYLQPGDMVMTRDAGLQELTWTGGRRVEATGDLAPIVITKGALGNTRDLVVSPQHRMLIEGWQAELLFGEAEVFVKAKDIVNDDTIYIREGGKVNYHHILFDDHQVVFAEGAASESFHPGPQALGALDQGPRDELLRLFPDLQCFGAPAINSARMSLKGFEAACLLN
ncbi:Hint domain-containing protein [Litoreibacter janthinus]|uniref:Hint domain-containing protein n=1 Tax=Litoreibacter janthinus TaxID=670154 RepID=A0A1I6HH94_9RHOB|nr:Hint domain-containing protein [Litoreibacter janthinus]SFR53647.1 Hint domain-containing protein [Litoreibacter janthinus]